MNKLDITDSKASEYLGKKVAIPQEYNPSILVAVPRIENRNKYSISENHLPFLGYDIWHCYEFSAMTLKGLPVTRVLKLKYSAFSPYIVESKSLKLYLNSYNLSKFGNSTEECLEKCKSLIERDLSEKLSVTVEVSFLKTPKHIEIFSSYSNVLNFIDESDIEIYEFKENPSLLEVTEGDNIKENFLKFDSLRSNCRVTHQPDFGDVFIYYRSKKSINCSSLVKYLVSFRNEYHFHEECCEMIYKRIYDLLDSGDALMVCTLYTRRGGIDISSVRYTNGFSSRDIDSILDLSAFARHGIKQ